MTEKPFTDVWCSETGHIGVTDNGVDKEFTGSEFEEWLNALHEEKEELKQRNEFLKKQLDRVCIDNERMGDKLKKIGRTLYEDLE